MEVWEIVEYMLRRWFSVMHVSVLGNPTGFFIHGTKMAILGKVFDKMLNRLLTIKRGEMLETKLISDHQSISMLNSVGSVE